MSSKSPTTRREQRPPTGTTTRVIIWTLAICFMVGVTGLAFGAVIAFTMYGFGSKLFAPRAQQAAHVPMPDLPAPPKLEEVADGPAPAALDGETRLKVTRATAYLRVIRTAGLIQEGTGFFAAEPGLVITSAHVVGMGASGCSAPANVEVTLNS